MRVRLALLLLLATTASACTASGLSFREDKRISIQQPSTDDEVALPLTVSWDAEDYDGYYGVFLDSTPMRPNRGLLSLVPSDDPCRAREICPDATWLAQRTIFVTKQTSLQIPRLPDRRSNGRSRDRHQLTIVLLDADGVRKGESAFVREFIVERD
jgi:hypothetical protein